MMRINPRSIMWGAMGPTVAVLAATVWILLREPPPLQVCRLADGSEIRLEAVTVGPRHWFLGGSRWQRLVGQRVQPPQAGRYTGAPDSLMFWISGSALLQMRGQPSAVIYDEHGCSLGPGWPRRWQAETRAAPYAYGWLIAHTPPQPKLLTFQLQQDSLPNGTVPLAEFAVTNPVRARYPEWKPEPLPATRRDGDLAITLVGLEVLPNFSVPLLQPTASSQTT
jgi:hypothetical protein